MSDQAAFEGSVDAAILKIYARVAANMTTATLVVERTAKQNCPVDQGLLRADIKSEVKPGANEIIGEIGNTLEYAPYVHQGTGIYALTGDGRKTPWFVPAVQAGKYKGEEGFWTRGQKAQPYLEDAKTENVGKISGILAGGG